MTEISDRWQQFSIPILWAARLRRQSCNSVGSDLIRFYSLNRRWPTSPPVKIEKYNQRTQEHPLCGGKTETLRKPNWCKQKAGKSALASTNCKSGCWLFKPYHRKPVNTFSADGRDTHKWPLLISQQHKNNSKHFVVVVKRTFLEMKLAVVQVCARELGCGLVSTQSLQYFL